MTMILRHATPNRNLDSILAYGLLTRFARGKRKCVWLHPSTRSLWAIEHVGQRHCCLYRDVSVLRIHVPGTHYHMVKKGPCGTFWYPHDIPPEWITASKTAIQCVEGEGW